MAPVPGRGRLPPARKDRETGRVFGRTSRYRRGVRAGNDGALLSREEALRSLADPETARSLDTFGSVVSASTRCATLASAGDRRRRRLETRSALLSGTRALFSATHGG